MVSLEEIVLQVLPPFALYEMSMLSVSSSSSVAVQVMRWLALQLSPPVGEVRVISGGLFGAALLIVKLLPELAVSVASPSLTTTLIR